MQTCHEFVASLISNQAVLDDALNSLVGTCEIPSLGETKVQTNCVLKDFQKDAIAWMLHQYARGNSFILGDDMGLGKTVETLAYYAYLREQHMNMFAYPSSIQGQSETQIHGVLDSLLDVDMQVRRFHTPSMVICSPLSVLDSWRQHVEKQLAEVTDPVVFLKLHGSLTERQECVSMIEQQRVYRVQERITQLRTEYSALVTEAKALSGSFTKYDTSYPKDKETTIIKKLTKYSGCDILVTTYETMMFDDMRAYFNTSVFSVAVVDEAHRLKNINSQLSKYFEELRTKGSFKQLALLTGTPCQNNLEEVWNLQAQVAVRPQSEGDMSLCQWYTNQACWERLYVCPGMNRDTSFLSTKDTFLYFFKDLQSVRYDDVLAFISMYKKYPVLEDLLDKCGTLGALVCLQQYLHTLLSLYLFRRSKMDVNLNLPERRSSILYCGMSEQQKNLYKAFLLRNEAGQLQCVNNPDTQNQSTMRCLNSIVQSLNKVVDHPYLIPNIEQPPYAMGTHIYENSSKMTVLHTLLEQQHTLKHRVLLFSKSTSMLDIIQDYAEFHMNYTVCRLDGAVTGQDRQQVIEEYTTSADPPFLFLQSTKAGGVGLNLLAADTVIFYNCEYNSALDEQAENRCYRIGQTKPVWVVRQIAKDTTEHVYFLRSQAKQALAMCIQQCKPFLHTTLQEKQGILHTLSNYKTKHQQSTTKGAIGVYVDNGDTDDVLQSLTRVFMNTPPVLSATEMYNLCLYGFGGPAPLLGQTTQGDEDQLEASQLTTRRIRTHDREENLEDLQHDQRINVDQTVFAKLQTTTTSTTMIDMTDSTSGAVATRNTSTDPMDITRYCKKVQTTVDNLVAQQPASDEFADITTQQSLRRDLGYLYTCVRHAYNNHTNQDIVFHTSPTSIDREEYNQYLSGVKQYVACCQQPHQRGVVEEQLYRLSSVNVTKEEVQFGFEEWLVSSGTYLSSPIQSVVDALSCCTGKVYKVDILNRKMVLENTSMVQNDLETETSTMDAQMHHLDGDIFHIEKTLGYSNMVCYESKYPTITNVNGTAPLASCNAFGQYHGYLILNYLNCHGEWSSRGRFFNTIQTLSPEAPQQYADLADNKRLTLGTTFITTCNRNEVVRRLGQQLDPQHIVQIANLCVYNHNNSDIAAPSLKKALDAIYIYAKVHNLCVITPKVAFSGAAGNNNTVWGRVEFALNTQLVLRNIDVFVMYYGGIVQRRAGNTSQNTLSGPTRPLTVTRAP